MSILNTDKIYWSAITIKGRDLDEIELSSSSIEVETDIEVEINGVSNTFEVEVDVDLDTHMEEIQDGIKSVWSQLPLTDLLDPIVRNFIKSLEESDAMLADEESANARSIFDAHVEAAFAKSS